MRKLLVVDDEPAALQLFHRVFAKEDVDVLTAETAAEGLEQIQCQQPDVAVFDVVLSDKNALLAFAEIQALDPKLPVIFITAHGTSETAIEAMKLGAFDYLVKPIDFAKMRQIVGQAFRVRRLMMAPVEIGPEQAPLSDDVLVGEAPVMQQVYKAIGRVAAQNVTVLIRGESGAGKELVARALYHHSRRADKPFMEVNCAAIPETLLESELFGHEKGAFTGAERRRIGKFEQCTGGTLFLDEIGDMSPSLQAKLLRVLQQQRFERVGGNETISTDVRLVAATNRNLEQMVADHQFRDDLYYRLNGYTISLPPLRERGEDVAVLARHFLRRCSRELSEDVSSISPEAMEIINRHPWPGNARQLQSVIRQAVLHSSGPMLLPEFLPEEIRAPHREADAHGDGAGQGSGYWDGFTSRQLASGCDEIYAEALQRMELEVITRVLQHTGGNQVEAAKRLGVTRTTLRSKIRSLNIVIDKVVSQDSPPTDE